MNASRRENGVGLIEILVAVFIVSLGFLAAARMQVDSMRSTQGAYYRSQAHFMASEMVNRMRANVDGVRRGAYDGQTTSDSAADPGCSSAKCSPDDIARQDVFDWSAHLHPLAGGDDFVALLPSLEAVDGNAAIDASATVVAVDGGRFRIDIVWGEIIDDTPTRQRLSTAFVTER